MAEVLRQYYFRLLLISFVDNFQLFQSPCDFRVSYSVFFFARNWLSSSKRGKNGRVGGGRRRRIDFLLVLLTQAFLLSPFSIILFSLAALSRLTFRGLRKRERKLSFSHTYFLSVFRFRAKNVNFAIFQRNIIPSQLRN